MSIDFIEAFFIFSLGASIGSFMNVVILRLPKKLSVILPRSKCLKCQSKISWFDNIPIISWLILKGKCRKCKGSISINYLLFEVFLGIIFLFIRSNQQLIYIGLSTFENMLISFIFVSILVPLIILDIKYYWLPSSIIKIGFLFGLFFNILYSFKMGNLIYLANLAAAASGFIFFALISILGELIAKQPVLGFGDAKLLGLIGMWLGFDGLFITIYISFIFAGLTCGFLLLLKKIKRKEIIPFGPFIIASTLSVWFLGVNFYKDIFFNKFVY